MEKESFKRIMKKSKDQNKIEANFAKEKCR